MEIVQLFNRYCVQPFLINNHRNKSLKAEKTIGFDNDVKFKKLL